MCVFQVTHNNEPQFSNEMMRKQINQKAERLNQTSKTTLPNATNQHTMLVLYTGVTYMH